MSDTSPEMLEPTPGTPPEAAAPLPQATTAERIIRTIGLRVIGIDGAIALIAVAVALWMTNAVDVTFQPLVDFTVFVFFPIVLKTFLPICVAALVGYAILWKLRPPDGRGFFETTFLRWRDLLGLVKCVAILLLTTMAISNIKPLIPLYNPRLYDKQLREFDFLLFLGNDPFAWLAKFRQPWIQEVLDLSYTSLFLMFFLTFGTLFVLRRRLPLAVFVLAFLLAALIGNLMHFLYPSIGDCFFASRKHLYDSILPELFSPRIQGGFYDTYRDIKKNPSGFQATPYMGLAAMPSLHMAQMYFFCALAWRYHRWLLALYVPMAILLSISTMYFGWHYFSDLVVGLALGWFALWLARRIIALNERLARRFIPPAGASAA